MIIERSRIYLATIGTDAPALAQAHGLGLELDEFCTAENFDAGFAEWDARARDALSKADRFVLHAPFAEMSPCAIDPRIRRVVRERLEQAAARCAAYGIDRMVVHSGFLPRVYYDEWFVAQSAKFFREFLAGCPASFELLIENVLDPDPACLRAMIEAIGDDRAGVCLDVGHAHVASQAPVREWLRALAPHIRHLHVHDNDGAFDAHLPPGEGTVGFPALFDAIDALVPRATITCECPDAAGCVRRLIEDGILTEKMR